MHLGASISHYNLSTINSDDCLKISIIMVLENPYMANIFLFFKLNLPVRNIFKSFEFCNTDIDCYIKPTVIKKKKINLKIIISST